MELQEREKEVPCSSDSCQVDPPLEFVYALKQLQLVSYQVKTYKRQKKMITGDYQSYFGFLPAETSAI